MTGYWSIDVPVSQEEGDADIAVLNQIQIPEEVTIWRAEVVVHGRRWQWEQIDDRSMG